MFANTFQSGFISVFYSVGSNPLSLWDKAVKNGHIRRIVDDDVKSLVLEISGTNVATTYITCPIKPKASLGIKLPFLVMVIKNLKKYFTFEIQILDDKDMHRRFRVSNFQSTTKVRPFCTTMPIGLSEGWNQIQFNLADFTRRAYGSTYIETMRVQIHANVRIRRIYFSDRLYGDDEMPSEFKLFLPVPGTQRRQTNTGSVSVAVDPKRTSKSESEKKAAVDEVPSGAPPTPVPEPEEAAAGAPTERQEEDQTPSVSRQEEVQVVAEEEGVGGAEEEPAVASIAEETGSAATASAVEQTQSVHSAEPRAEADGEGGEEGPPPEDAAAVASVAEETGSAAAAPAGDAPEEEAEAAPPPEELPPQEAEEEALPPAAEEAEAPPTEALEEEATEEVPPAPEEPPAE